MKTLLPASAIILFAFGCFAQQGDSIIFQRPVTGSNLLHCNLIINIGAGFEQRNAGFITANGEYVKISGGGGAGIGLQFGMAMFESNLDLCLAASFQVTPMTPAISNGSGTFSRTLIEPLIKYMFMLGRKRRSINAGLGADFSSNPAMDIDASKIPNGAHNIWKYKNAAGPVVIFEYQTVRKKLGFNMGVKFYSIKYKLKSVVSNGTSYPINVVPAAILSEVDNLSGSGLDFYFGIGYYF